MIENSNLLKINYTKFTLPNGVKCVLYQRNEIHSVSIRVTVNTGSLDEDKDSNGISHFIEHVSHDGTVDLPTWDAIDNYVNEISGNTNAYTSYDHTQYHGTFPSQYLEKAIFYFSQVVLQPLIKSSDVDKERTIILDEKKRYEDSVGDRIRKVLRNSRFKDQSTPYTLDIIGTTKNLKAFSPEDLIHYYNKHYTPENLEVYIVGNMDIDEATRCLEKYFHQNISAKAFGKKPKREFKENYPDYSDFLVKTARKADVDSYYLTVSFPSFEFSLAPVEERYKVEFLQFITASSSYFQSVLWKRLREELNLVYGVSAFTYDLYARNMFGIQTSFKKDVLEIVLKEIYDGINCIKLQEVTDLVFRARRKKLLDTQLMQMDDPDNVLEWIETYENEVEEHGRGMTLGDYLDFIQSLKFEDIITVANKIFDWNQVNIGIVSKDDPKDVEETVKEMWERITNPVNAAQLKMI